MLDEIGADRLASTNFPMENWKKTRPNNPQERLRKEIKRRTDVADMFPNHLNELPDVQITRPAELCIETPQFTGSRDELYRTQTFSGFVLDTRVTTMAITINTDDDFPEALRSNPNFHEAPRRELLTESLIGLPDVIAEFLAEECPHHYRRDGDSIDTPRLRFCEKH